MSPAPPDAEVGSPEKGLPEDWKWTTGLVVELGFVGLI